MKCDVSLSAFCQVPAQIISESVKQIRRETSPSSVSDCGKGFLILMRRKLVSEPSAG